MIKTIIYVLLGVTILGALIFFLGFGGAFWITYGEPTTPIEQDIIEGENNAAKDEEVETIETFRVLVLGDSLAKGTGDDTGLGYGGLVNESLNETFNVVEYRNLGVDGLTSKGLLELMQDEQVLIAVEEADLILLSIGGNDLRTLLVFEVIAATEFFNLKSSYLENFQEILATIRRINSDVLIAKLGLYNPFYGFIPQENLDLLHQWNSDTLQAVEAGAGMVFVPTFDLFKYNPELISVDMLHPNSKGYRLVAQRHIEVLHGLLKETE